MGDALAIPVRELTEALVTMAVGLRDRWRKRC
jgi:hypothetical protein